MNQATLDKSKQLRIKARINEAGVAIVLTFLNEDGSPHAITDMGWELPLKKAQNTTTNVFKLTEGDGLTVFGDDDNKLRIEVSRARATVQAQTYFYTLYSSEEDHTWLNGDWDFHNGVFDGVEETEEIIISESGTQVTIVVSSDGSGSVDHFCGPFDASPGAFPTTQGNGADGAFLGGDYVVVTEGGVINGVFVAPMSIIMALQDDPDEDWTPTGYRQI